MFFRKEVEEIKTEKEQWTIHLGFATTKEYVEHMRETGAWGSAEYQKKFMEKKAKKGKNQ